MLGGRSICPWPATRRDTFEHMTAPLIEMYTTSWCPYCTRAKHLLERKGASFEEISIEDYPERRAEMIQRSGRRTVPQIFIDGHPIGGPRELAAVEEAGAPGSLLSAAPAAGAVTIPE